MSDALKEAIAKHMGYDSADNEEFVQTMSDVAKGGADAGWAGFTYTGDSVAFFNAHESAIMDRAYDDADSFGYKGVGEFVATFARADMLDSGPDGYANLLAWYILEAVAYEMDVDNG